MPILNGKWKFNDIPQYSKSAGYYQTGASITQEVQFVTGKNVSFDDYVGVEYVGINVQFAATTSNSGRCQLTYLAPEGSSLVDRETVVYNPGYGYWIDTEHQFVDFGSEGREVDNRFYLWFKDNATLIEAPIPPETLVSIRGEWRWNNVITNDQGSNFDVSVTFYIGGGGTSFESIRVYGEGQNKTIYYGNVMAYDEADDGWLSSIYQTISFGPDATVPKGFYDWFIQNAVDVSTLPPDTDVWGILTWRQSITFPTGTYVYSQGFVSGNRMFSKLEVNYGRGVILYDDLKVWSSVSGWTDELYRTIDFGRTKQEMDPYLYMWLMDNATLTGRYAATELRGLWQWKDSVANRGRIVGYFAKTIESITVKACGYYWSELTVETEPPLYRAEIYYEDKAIYKADDGGWINEDKVQFIDFGPTPQNVSPEFYYWFLDNAAEVPVYTIKESTLVEIANAIRAKSVAFDGLTPPEMVETVLGIGEEEVLTIEEINAIMEG